MVEIVKQYGSARIIVNSAADWGVSDPLAVPKTAARMIEKGIDEKDVHLTCYKNALSVYGLSGNMKECDWDDDSIIDQSDRFDGNSVLR